MLLEEFVKDLIDGAMRDISRRLALRNILTGIRHDAYPGLSDELTPFNAV